MMTPMLLWTLAACLVLVGLIGTIYPLFPGIIVLFLGLVIGAWADDFTRVGFGTLGILAGLTVIAYLVDFISGALGARYFGAGKRAAIGALIGAAIGIFIGLPGLIIGPFIGAAIGELTAKRTLEEAARAGVGTTLGFVAGIAVKLLIGIAMIVIFMVTRFT